MNEAQAKDRLIIEMEDNERLAARIKDLQAQISRQPVAGQRQVTHWEDCWRAPDHHACAVAKIERLTAKLADLEYVMTARKARAVLIQVGAGTGKPGDFRWIATDFIRETKAYKTRGKARRAWKRKKRFEAGPHIYQRKESM